MTKPTCVHGLDLEWDCDLCRELVEEEIAAKERNSE